MLIQFRFQNFHSFRDDTILDLTAAQVSENANSVVSLGNEKLLPVLSIYGANASGKSNVLKAFGLMQEYVMESLSYGGEAWKGREVRVHYPLIPFLLDGESRFEPSTFEVYYIDPEDAKERTWQYGFVLDQEGVVEEWLNTKAKSVKDFRSVFYRNRETSELDLSGLPKNSHENIRIALEPETLVVSLGAKLKIELLKAVSDWFANLGYLDFGDPSENMALSKLVSRAFVEDKDEQKRVAEFLSAFDPTIAGFDVDQGEENRQITINVLHRAADGGLYPINMRAESDGTQKMFALYPMLSAVLKQGSVLMVDELNARLHPLLVRSILQTFIDPARNPNHAQLIFTAHDVWQLTNGLLRRDEVWFTEKEPDGASTLYSLADFVDEDGNKIRKDESFEKNYLLGKYGAIPILRAFELAKKAGVDDGEA